MSRTTMRLVSVLFFLCCSPSFISNSQLWAQTAAVTKFTSRSQLVVVPVVVTGKNGAHIAGLARDAFKIEEQGKVRTATIFEEVKTVAPGVSPRAAHALEGRSNFNFVDAQNWRMTMVVMDTLNTPVLSQTEGKRQLIAYLSKSLQREEPTALFGLGRNGLKQLHPFTTDTSVLLDALKSLKRQIGPDEKNDPQAAMVANTADMIVQLSTISHDPKANETAQHISDFMNDTESLMNGFEEREAIRTTLTAMTQIAHAYQAIPGRKTLIWASGGFPFMIDDPRAFARIGTDMFERYEETWRALVAADIAVYTVDVTGLGGVGTGMATGHFDGSRPAWVRPSARTGTGSAVSIPYDKAAQKQDTLRAFAEATGGTPCVNTNDIEKCFEHAVDDSRSYYLLGYYLPSDDQKPGWRKLKVKVSAEGAHVRAREGFYVTAPAEDSPAVRQRQIVRALQSPVEFTGVRLNVSEVPAKTAAKQVSGGKTIHQFMVAVLGSSLTVDTQHQNAVDVTVVCAAFSADGKNAGQTERQLVTKLPPEALVKVRNLGMGVPQSLELAPGKYDLRCAVRDNLNGEVGSVEYPVSVK